jgi:UDP-glucose 4-epimerase
VTGGAGFIGSHTVEMLVDAGCSVLVIDDMSHPCGASLPVSVEVLVTDCGSAEAATALLRFRPGAVLHLAAKGGVARALRDPGTHVKQGLATTVNLFNSASAAGAQVLATASSGGAVYGSAPALPASEAMPPAPRSPYGAGKAAEELYLATFQRLEPRIKSAVALRYSNVYGPRQDGTGEAGVVAITCWKLCADEPPVIYGDGEQSRDFVFVRDIARANLAALVSGYSGPVNVGTGRETSIGRVVDILVGQHGGALHAVHREPRLGEVRRTCLDISIARDSLGWRPMVDVEAGLARTYAWFASEQRVPVP